MNRRERRAAAAGVRAIKGPLPEDLEPTEGMRRLLMEEAEKLLTSARDSGVDHDDIALLAINVSKGGPRYMAAILHSIYGRGEHDTDWWEKTIAAQAGDTAFLWAHVDVLRDIVGIVGVPLDWTDHPQHEACRVAFVTGDEEHFAVVPSWLLYKTLQSGSSAVN